MNIGVDFDNTLVCFDDLFYRAAVEKNWIPKETPASKEQVRDYLRKMGKEPSWTELQGMVYGVLIQDAPAYPGVAEFMTACFRSKIPVSIISHKTRIPFLGEPHDLHAAARKWLVNQGCHTMWGIPQERVFLEVTKAKKLKRIAAEQCTHFVDDLPEFLNDTDFPSNVKKIFFDPHGRSVQKEFWLIARDWDHILWRLIEGK